MFHLQILKIALESNFNFGYILMTCEEQSLKKKVIIFTILIL